MCSMKPHNWRPSFGRNNSICILFVDSKIKSFENGKQVPNKWPEFRNVLHSFTFTHTCTKFANENSSIFNFEFAQFVFKVFCYTFLIFYVLGLCFGNCLDAGWPSHFHFRNGILTKRKKDKIIWIKTKEDNGKELTWLKWKQTGYWTNFIFFCLCFYLLIFYSFESTHVETYFFLIFVLKCVNWCQQYMKRVKNSQQIFRSRWRQTAYKLQRQQKKNKFFVVDTFRYMQTIKFIDKLWAHTMLHTYMLIWIEY